MATNRYRHNIDSVGDELERGNQQQQADNAAMRAELEQQRRAQENYNFQMWIQTPNGQEFQSWERAAEKYLELLDRVQSNFEICRKKDGNEIRAENERWAQQLRGGLPVYLQHRLKFRRGLAALAALLVAVGTVLNNGGGALWVIFAGILGLVVYFLATAVLKQVEVLLGARHGRRTLATQGMSAPDINQLLDRKRERFSYYFTRASDGTMSRSEFLGKTVNGSHSFALEHRSFTPVPIDEITDSIRRFSLEARRMLPAPEQLPDLQLPVAENPGNVPAESHAAKCLLHYAKIVAEF